MKIVHVNKFFYERGGAERVLFLYARELTDRGHEVIPFAMQHPQNMKTKYSKYFVSRIRFGVDAHRSFEEAIRGTLRMIWSREAAAQFDALLTDTRPDVIHIHNIYHQLSPSILAVATRHGIPVIMSVHDWNLIWPDYLLCGYDGGASPWNAVRQRCTQGSTAKSFLTYATWQLHHMMGAYVKHINQYLAPSVFVRILLEQHGVGGNQITRLPHAVAEPFFEQKKTKRSGRPTLLYSGRLSAEKGVDTILQMMEDETLAVDVVFAGEGPLQKRVQTAAKDKRITFLGHRTTPALIAEIDKATAVLVPSTVRETFGLSVLEAFARGRTVIASKIGALPELVSHKKTGLLVPPGDAAALTSAVQELNDDAALRRTLERAAKKRAATHRTATIIDVLEKEYKNLLSS